MSETLQHHVPGVGWWTVSRECDDGVLVRVTAPGTVPLFLTPAEARSVAAHLVDLADKTEGR